MSLDPVGILLNANSGSEWALMHISDKIPADAAGPHVSGEEQGLQDPLGPLPTPSLNYQLSQSTSLPLLFAPFYLLSGCSYFILQIQPCHVVGNLS